MTRGGPSEILPQVVFVLGGGVLADRIGRRPAMLGADALCCAAQGWARAPAAPDAAALTQQRLMG